MGLFTRSMYGTAREAENWGGAQSRRYRRKWTRLGASAGRRRPVGTRPGTTLCPALCLIRPAAFAQNRPSFKLKHVSVVHCLQRAWRRAQTSVAPCAVLLSQRENRHSSTAIALGL